MDIIVYFRIKQLFIDAVGLIGVVLLFDFLLLLPSYFLGISWIYPTIFALVFVTCVIYPWLWGIIRYVVFHKPILIINKYGVEIYTFSTPYIFFVPWSKIQTISIVEHKAIKYIYIYRKEEKGYLSNFSFFKRFIIRLWRPKGQALLHISLHYLDTPAIEIFQQISQRYANELQEHNIQLQL